MPLQRGFHGHPPTREGRHAEFPDRLLVAASGDCDFLRRWPLSSLSLTLMPVLASLLLPRQIEEREPLLMRMAHAIHYPVLQFSMHHKTAVIAFAGAVLIVTYGMIAPNLGSEFVPRLLYMIFNAAFERHPTERPSQPLERNLP